MSSPNPYAPPTAEVADVIHASSHAEAVRRVHIKHESAVRSVGTLYMTGGVMAPVTAMVLLVFGIEPAGSYELYVLHAILAVLAVMSFLVGRGVRKLRRWSHPSAVILALIGLITFPLGVLLDLYILYLLLVRRGRYVFKPEYAAVVAATPQIEPQPTIALWVLVALLFVLIAGLVASFIGP